MTDPPDLEIDEPTTARPGWARWGFDWRTWLTVGIVGIVFVIPLRALFKYQGPPMEEGFMLVFPERVLRGDIPHEDFLHLYGPGSLWALAAWFKVVGVSLTAERFFGMCQLGGIVFGVMALVRPWGRRAMLAAGIFGVLLTMTAIGLTALAWDGAVALAVVGVWAGLRGRRWLTGDVPDERRGGRLLVLSGVLAGLALLFRPDAVVAVAISTLALLAGLGWGRWKRWLLGAVPVLSLYLVHLAISGPGNAIRGMFIEPVFKLRDGRSLPRPPSRTGFDGALQAVAQLRPQPWSGPHLTGPQQVFVWFFLLPLVTLFIVGVGWWSVRRDRSDWRARVVLTVGLLGLGLMPQAMQRVDTTHFAWVSCVPLAFLPAALAELGRHLPVRPVRRQAGTIAAALTLLIPLVVIPFFTSRTYLDLAKQSRPGHQVFGYPVVYSGRTFYLGAKDIAPAAQAMLDTLGPEMKKGQRLFVGTADLRKTPYSDAYLYYLLPKMKPGTRYIEMDPGMANAEGSGLAEEVRHADWLILSHVWDAWSEPNTSRDFGPDEPNRVVKAHFCLRGDFRALSEDPAKPGKPVFEVYERCR